jgi:transposase InsO family protein
LGDYGQILPAAESGESQIGSTMSIWLSMLRFRIHLRCSQAAGSLAIGWRMAWFRILTVVDQFTRECVALLADRSMTGEKVSETLDAAIASRGAPESITVDNGSEFASKAMDPWAYRNGVQLHFIRPGKPIENAYAERWVRSMKEECLSNLILFGEGSIRRALTEFIEHFHCERNHQGKGNVLLFADKSTAPRSAGHCMRCRERLGGLLRFYDYAA